MLEVNTEKKTRLFPSPVPIYPNPFISSILKKYHSPQKISFSAKNIILRVPTLSPPNIPLLYPPSTPLPLLRLP